MKIRWLTYHSLQSHILGPIWVSIPQKARWKIVVWLDRSRRRCWSDLVSDAMAEREDDACDIHTPSLRPGPAPRCASTCEWFGPAGQHEGQHECGCYCGKFEFIAPNGRHDREKAN